MKNVPKRLVKSVLITLGFTLASATETTIQKKIFGSVITTLMVSNEEVDDVVKKIKSLGESGLLIKRRQ